MKPLHCFDLSKELNMSLHFQFIADDIMYNCPNFDNHCPNVGNSLNSKCVHITIRCLNC